MSEVNPQLLAFLGEEASDTNTPASEPDQAAPEATEADEAAETIIETTEAPTEARTVEAPAAKPKKAPPPLSPDFTEAARRKSQQALAQQQEKQDKPTPVDLDDLAIKDPVAYFKARGLDPMMVAKSIMSSQLGDAAPPELADGPHKLALEHRFYQLQKEIETLKAERQRAAEEAQRASQEQRELSHIESYIPDIPQELTYVSLLANKNPSELVNRLKQAVRHIAQTDPDAHTKTLEDAARLLDSALKRDLEMLGFTQPQQAKPRLVAKNNLSTLTVPAPEPQSDEELRAQIINELRTGRRLDV